MFARTQRLLLRPGWIEDADALGKAWDDEAIARQLLDIPAPLPVDDGAGTAREMAAGFLARDHNPRAPYFLLFARTGGSPRLVGGCGIARREDDRPEIAFWIARHFWGLGFATEAASAVVRSLRASGFQRLIARPAVDNRSAMRVLAKLGFRSTGRTEKRHSTARGGAIACALFEDEGLMPMRDGIGWDMRTDHVDREPIAA